MLPPFDIKDLEIGFLKNPPIIDLRYFQDSDNLLKQHANSQAVLIISHYHKSNKIHSYPFMNENLLKHYSKKKIDVIKQC